MTKLLSIQHLLNPNAPVKATKVFGGESSGILNWNDIKHQIFHIMYKRYKANFWNPEEISMGDDVKMWGSLTPHEQDRFLRVNAQLASLDSLQTPAITLLTAYTSDPALKQALALIAQQEAIHTESYSYILSSLVPLEVQNKYFDDARNNPMIIKRNKYVLDAYQEFIEEPSIENLIKFLARSVVLEGIFFYSGFAFFYNLARQQKMMKTATMIQYIQRDEMQHAYLISQLIEIVLSENPEVDREWANSYITETITTAVEYELEWSEHLFEGIDNIDMAEFKDYIEYLGNKRLRQAGLPNFYKDNHNPMPWITVYSDEMLSDTKTDFFENKSREYAKVSEENGFDEL